MNLSWLLGHIFEQLRKYDLSGKLVLHGQSFFGKLMYWFPYRLLDYAPTYFDIKTFPDGETKRALVRVANKRAGKMDRLDEGKGGPNERAKKKQKKMKS